MIQLFNSLTQKKETLTPIQPGVFKMYVCGNTVYDHAHIGHGRTWVVFDSFAKYLRSEGLEVIYVHNITDIDDKIIQRARENQESCEALTNRFISEMHADEAALLCDRATHEPKATEYVDEIIDLIQKLVDKGYAYTSQNGDVNYSVHAFKDYGKLSNRDLEKLQAGSRVEIDENKENPLDFVLWKQAKSGEPAWNSPWGPGRPGWHIECSAMSTKLLGQPFDLHGGGVDLKFPHHENEIAQSEAVCHSPLTKHWMHVGHLQINDEKMSKSLGNFLTIREVLHQFPAEVVRYFLLSSHYRSPVNYSKAQLENAKQALTRLYLALRELPDAVKDDTFAVITEPFKQKFKAALQDDFNTPEAFAVLFEVSREMNRLRSKGELQAAANLGALMRELVQPFSVLQLNPHEFLSGHFSTEEEAEITLLVQQRDEARRQKNWAESDRIRDALLQLNIVLEDGPDGSTAWRRKNG